MCTYATEKVDVTGSGKGPGGWFPLTAATVYFDHPVHAPAEHTLNIDFLNPERGPSSPSAPSRARWTPRVLEAQLGRLSAPRPGVLGRSVRRAALITARLAAFPGRLTAWPGQRLGLPPWSQPRVRSGHRSWRMEGRPAPPRTCARVLRRRPRL